MAIALHRTTDRPASRARWMRQQTSESSSLLAILMLALLTIGIMTMLMSVQALPTIGLSNLGALTQQAVPVRPTDGAVPAGRAAPAPSTAAMSLPAPAAISAPPPAPAPAPVAQAPEAIAPAIDAAPSAAAFAVGQRTKIAHTDGQGVVLHSRPSEDARQPAGLMEGREVTILELSGTDWARVQSDAKQAGWISTQYLAAE